MELRIYIWTLGRSDRAGKVKICVCMYMNSTQPQGYSWKFKNISLCIRLTSARGQLGNRNIPWDVVWSWDWHGGMGMVRVLMRPWVQAPQKYYLFVECQLKSFLFVVLKTNKRKNILLLSAKNRRLLNCCKSSVLPQMNGKYSQRNAKYSQVNGKYSQIIGKYSQLNSKFSQINNSFLRQPYFCKTAKPSPPLPLNKQIEILNIFFRASTHSKVKDLLTILLQV